MRRLLAIVQIASLLIGPVLCAPHVHADVAAEGHSHRPHVHLHGKSAHGHRHAGQAGHRHSPDPRSAVNRRETNHRSTRFREQAAAHDADAFYLTTTTVAAVRCTGLADWLGPVRAPMYGEIAADGAGCATAAEWDHLLRPPNGLSEVYLRTLRLRI